MLARANRDPLRLVIIAYDTPSDRRRRKMAKLLDDFGSRAQMSVFEAMLTATQMAWLCRRMEGLIEPAEDKVYIVSACNRCQTEVVRLGLQAPIEAPAFFLA